MLQILSSAYKHGLDRLDTAVPMNDKSDEQLAHEISAWLDEVDPETLDFRDAKHFRRIIRAREQLDAAQAEIRDAVAAAREAGDSWTIIGAALGVSRQSAWERFGPRSD